MKIIFIYHPPKSAGGEIRVDEARQKDEKRNSAAVQNASLTQRIKNTRRKGSYFFVIDAFIASIIIIAAIIISTTQFSAKPIASITYYTAEDFMTIIETTTIRDYGYSDTIQQMVNDKRIDNTQRTLLQQMAYFYNKGDMPDAQLMAQVLLNSTPKTTSVNISINTGTTKITLGNVTRSSYNDAVVVFSTQRIVLLKINNTNTYPPTVVEVQTWQ